MFDELDYRIEAANQEEFWRRYAGHPFIRIPEVVPRAVDAARAHDRVGRRHGRGPSSRRRADRAARQRAAEVLFRFAQGSVHRDGVFNGDPHPGNYRFHADGTITFLDFGLVKRWSAGRVGAAVAVPRRDPRPRSRVVSCARWSRSASSVPTTVSTRSSCSSTSSAPYVPYLQDTFTFTRQFTAEALGKVVEHRRARTPRSSARSTCRASFVILDRVVWGVSALLGKLEATGPWRAMLEEYRHGGPPSTPLGELEAKWQAAV